MTIVLMNVDHSDKGEGGGLTAENLLTLYVNEPKEKSGEEFLTRERVTFCTRKRLMTNANRECKGWEGRSQLRNGSV